ncbi:MAG: gamma-glutamyltransferase [Flavobacteriaceae bacterium]|nr:gamma-glutamyltransferase [Flavobacteriaceae bacterium]
MKRFYLFIAISIYCLSCRQAQKLNETQETNRGLVTEHAMVVSAREEASKIGTEILKKGGNAFDAMIATEFALAVSYPFAGNLGGGGFMVYRLENGGVGALDYREKAPLASDREMYLNALGNVIPNKSTLGAMAVGVPGTVAGMFEVHQKFGTLTWSEIINPVLELAERGIVVTSSQEKRFKTYQDLFLKTNKDSIVFTKPWKANDTIRFPALANTLKRIMEHGKNEFYNGEIANILVNFIKENGGIITLEDLHRYDAKWREPIVFYYDDLKIISMSPPSSGGICLAQILKMIEPYNIEQYKYNSTQYIQLLTEAERRAYADRSYYLGDPDFVDIHIEKLISNNYLKERMSTFSFNEATSSSDVSHGNVSFVESMETTHYSIVDQYGNAIAATTTLNGAYGSKLYCSQLGFFLNNEMDDFSSKPGVPNMFGLIGAEANSIAPEKRMLSSMTPTIVEKHNKLYMTLGTPGGSTIITSVLQTILNVHEYNMNMQEAVDAPRFHHQWLPDEIIMEPNVFNKTLKDSLQLLGYSTNENKTPILGKVDGILILENGNLEGGADKRGDDKAIGF